MRTLRFLAALLALSTSAFAADIEILGTFDPSGNFPLYRDTAGFGGFRVVADDTARYAITAGRRTEGMEVYSVAEAKTYRLVGGITNGDWVEVTFGGGSFDAITSGSNMTAAMVVDSGASLGYSGSGTIAATSLEAKTWEVPGTIGSTTPNAGTFTVLTPTTSPMVIGNDSDFTIEMPGNTSAVGSALRVHGQDAFVDGFSGNYGGDIHITGGMGDASSGGLDGVVFIGSDPTWPTYNGRIIIGGGASSTQYFVGNDLSIGDSVVEVVHDAYLEGGVFVFGPTMVVGRPDNGFAINVSSPANNVDGYLFEINGQNANPTSDKNGGSLRFRAGAKDGSGVDGSIIIGDANTNITSVEGGDYVNVEDVWFLRSDCGDDGCLGRNISTPFITGDDSTSSLSLEVNSGDIIDVTSTVATGNGFFGSGQTNSTSGGGTGDVRGGSGSAVGASGAEYSGASLWSSGDVVSGTAGDTGIDCGSSSTGTCTVYVGHTNADEIRIAKTGNALGFFGADAIPQQTGYSLTNNVTVGGTNDQLDDFTSLGVYALDAATIRNDIYQLGRFVDRIEQRLRNLGLFN